jgi:hypothetical protein
MLPVHIYLRFAHHCLLPRIGSDLPPVPVLKSWLEEQGRRNDFLLAVGVQGRHSLRSL